ncbi:MAG: Coenzyme F420 hydrogenase/dehydrogenase, beta subunit C-terminal domain [Candidatus Lokiarchaeota archaeon]|nr:Coenzyme F420 hydrogenase/dehydrogenase, beta subunit C-terminal domain [Candidatus Lokiarchaeota archaeon]
MSNTAAVKKGDQPNFKRIISEVLDKHKCCDCGICQSVCFLAGAGVIKYERPAYRVYDDEKCARCGFCQAACPVTSYDTSDSDYRIFRGFIGNHMSIRSFKSKVPGVAERAQDGGAVTSMLLYMIENNVVDAVMVTRFLKGWEPSSFLTNKREDIIAAAGSKYATNPVFNAITSLKDLPPAEVAKYGVKKIDDLRIAVVGLPCQISGLTKVQNLGIFPSNLIKVKVGLFCFKNYNWMRFQEFLTKKLKIKLDEISKMSILGDMTIKLTSGKVITVKSKDYDTLVNEGCAWCKDLTGHDADVSCGNIGSNEGGTTVVARTKKGLDIVDRARVAGYMEDVGVVNMDEITKQARMKLDRAKTE